MLSPGQLSRNQAMDLQQSRNPATLESVLRQLEIFRKCRLNRGGSIAASEFTMEDILLQVEGAWDFKYKIPHALYGSVAINAVKQQIITHVGYGRASRGAANHREVRTYKFCNHDGIKPVKQIP